MKETGFLKTGSPPDFPRLHTLLERMGELKLTMRVGVQRICSLSALIYPPSPTFAL